MVLLEKSNLDVWLFQCMSLRLEKLFKSFTDFDLLHRFKALLLDLELFNIEKPLDYYGIKPINVKLDDDYENCLITTNYFINNLLPIRKAVLSMSQAELSENSLKIIYNLKVDGKSQV